MSSLLREPAMLAARPLNSILYFGCENLELGIESNIVLIQQAHTVKYDIFEIRNEYWAVSVRTQKGHVHSITSVNIIIKTFICLMFWSEHIHFFMI